MIAWAVIAVRNLFRNKRRSLFTAAAVGLGFAAINVFGGFTDYVFGSLSEAFIYAQGTGHLVIFKRGFLTEGQFDPQKYLLTEADVAAIRKSCASDPRILLVSPRLQTNAMLGNGNTSTIAIALGFVPSEMDALRKSDRGRRRDLRYHEGRPLDDAAPNAIGLSTGLAKKLRISLDSDAMLFGTTIEGQVNALDVQVIQTFDTANEALNDKLVTCPLSLVQSLLDTKGVDRISVVLDDGGQVQAVRQSLEQSLSSQGVEIKTWIELSPLYERSKKMFEVIFTFVFVVVIAIVLMSVINTVGMSVMERTQEIGTMRALGLKRQGIVRLFAMEAAALGIAGSLAGSLLTLLVWGSMRIAAPTWVPPALALRVPLEVYLVPGYLLGSFACLVVLTVVAAVFPARKAAAQNIVEALGHV